MQHFPTIADAVAAGAPECFSDEYAFYERLGGPIPGGYFPAIDPDPEFPEPEFPGAGQPGPLTAPPTPATVYCHEGDDTVCPTPTPTCGCPPF